MEKNFKKPVEPKLYPWERGIDKRRGPDFWVRSLTWLGLIGWFIVVLGLAVIDKAKPKTGTFLDKHHSIEIKEQLFWNHDLTTIFFCLMILGIVISGGGLIVNSTRMKRKGDEYRLSLILVGILSLAGMFFYFFGMR
jgi:hypothetical protein